MNIQYYRLEYCCVLMNSASVDPVVCRVACPPPIPHPSYSFGALRNDKFSENNGKLKNCCVVVFICCENGLIFHSAALVIGVDVQCLAAAAY